MGGMRDMFVTLVVFGSLPFILARPFVGILMWSWIGYMNPHRLSWGFTTDFPFAQVIALATLAGLIFSREPKRIPWTRETVLLVLFILWMLVTTFFAFHQDAAWMQMEKVAKIQLMTFFTFDIDDDP
jgi:probable O-glycosylation ligase (exosortase A-associated)